MDRYASKVAEMRALVDRGDTQALELLFSEARAARNRWLAGEYEP
jgi:prephenate dehydrogenase